MCIDNPTVKPEPGAVTKMINEEIGAFVQREIFSAEEWRDLRGRYSGVPDLVLLKAIALQTEFIIFLDMYKASRDLHDRRLAAHEREFAR